MKRQFVRVFLFLLITHHLSLITSSCSSISCPVDNIVATNYVICDADGNEASIVDTLWIWSERSDGSDTLLFNAGIGLTSFSLPIGYANPEDTLLFIFMSRPDYLVADTVFIKKDNIPHFESVDCSASFFHRLTAVRTSHNAIEALTINKDFVDYDAETPHFYISIKDRR